MSSPAAPETTSAAIDASSDGLAKLPTRQPKTPRTASDEQPAAAAEGDLFAAFGTPAGVPAAPSDPSADLFAPIDAGSSLPRRTATSSAPTEEAAPGGDATAEPSADNDPQPPVPPLPTRDPAAVGTVSPQVTSAGLIRRTPKQIDVPEESKYAPGATSTASPSSQIAPTANRSPDEVRQMLSRYRAGLRKGRAPEPGNDQTNRRS
jgi:hypothetical protein